MFFAIQGLSKSSKIRIHRGTYIISLNMIIHRFNIAKNKQSIGDLIKLPYAINSKINFYLNYCKISKLHEVKV